MPGHDRGPQPKPRTAWSKIDHRPWHVRVPALVHADGSPLGEPEKLRHPDRIDEVLRVHARRHLAILMQLTGVDKVCIQVSTPNRRAAQARRSASRSRALSRRFAASASADTLPTSPPATALLRLRPQRLPPQTAGTWLQARVRLTARTSSASKASSTASFVRGGRRLLAEHAEPDDDGELHKKPRRRQTKSITAWMAPDVPLSRGPTPKAPWPAWYSTKQASARQRSPPRGPTAPDVPAKGPTAINS